MANISFLYSSIQLQSESLHSHYPRHPLVHCCVMQLISQHGVNVSYHSNWPQQFNTQYGHNPIYFQDQMQHVSPLWQMPAVGHAPSDNSQHYGYFASGYSQSFPHHEQNVIMYPNHQVHNDQGYRHHPSWSSLVSSTGSIGSVGSLGHSSIRRRPTKKQPKKKHYVVTSAATRYDGGTLISMKGKFRLQV